MCYGYHHQYNLIKLDSYLEVERIIINDQYTINDCDCSTFSITKSLVDETKYINALSCSNNNKIIYVDLPEGFIYDKTQKFIIETTTIMKFMLTTNLIDDTSYIENIKEYSTHNEVYNTVNEIYSTNNEEDRNKY